MGYGISVKKKSKKSKLAILWDLIELKHFPLFCPSRLHEVKIAHRKAENQIKMAKMIMMNELNKRANLLIEQLEVITSFLSFLSFSQLWVFMRKIQNCLDVISPESKQTATSNNLSELLKTSLVPWATSVRNKSRWFAVKIAPLCAPSARKLMTELVFVDFILFFYRKFHRTFSTVWRTSCKGQ